MAAAAPRRRVGWVDSATKLLIWLPQFRIDTSRPELTVHSHPPNPQESPELPPRPPLPPDGPGPLRRLRRHHLPHRHPQSCAGYMWPQTCRLRKKSVLPCDICQFYEMCSSREQVPRH